jgi:hypothetical protein
LNQQINKCLSKQKNIVAGNISIGVDTEHPKGNGLIRLPTIHKRTVSGSGVRLIPVCERSINCGGWGINYPIRYHGPWDAYPVTVQPESLNMQGDSRRLTKNQRHINHSLSVIRLFIIKACLLQMDNTMRGLDPRVSYK